MWTRLTLIVVFLSLVKMEPQKPAAPATPVPAVPGTPGPPAPVMPGPALVAPPAPAAPQRPVKMDSIAMANSIVQFSTKFLNELDKTKSVVSSPVSAEFLLGLVALGSTDAGHDEILTTLGLPNDEGVRDTFKLVGKTLKDVVGVTLNVANKIYLKEGHYDLALAFRNDAVSIFDAEVEKIDFTLRGGAAKIMNTWVENKTNKRITDLISADDINTDTRLVLINALYFKGTWKKQFDPALTTELPFYVTAYKSFPVPMMFMDSEFSFGESEGLNSKLLSMLYMGEQASMLIILPNKVDGLNDVIQKLAEGHSIVTEVGKMTKTKVQVTLPKFKIETELDLTTLLPKLGIKTIFNKVNSGVTKLLNRNDEPLFVSKAVQKAFIEVNEEGAEAAAATVMGVRTRRSLPPEPAKFTVDRPALCCVLVDGVPVFHAVYRPRPTGTRDEF